VKLNWYEMANFCLLWLKPNMAAPSWRSVVAVMVAFLVLQPPTPLRAHEFWIEPSTFQPDLNVTMTADVLIGTDFLGAAGIYVPDDIEAFALVAGTSGTRMPITGRYGDRPAGKFVVTVPGLNILLHQTAPIYLTYGDPQKFESFAREKGFATAMATHLARGLSPELIRERYQRFAKSLIAVGRGDAAHRGQDRLLGLRWELLAETNPYGRPRPNSMTVRLFAAGQPQAGAQVTVFVRRGPRDVSLQKHQTDADGRIMFPVRPGHDYLVDSVRLLPIDAPDEPQKAVWESLWASLSFRLPQD
jgi:hypothetical protein